MPDWYPEAELERHGISPDDFDEPGCYALSLEVPARTEAYFRDHWHAHYNVQPPRELVSAVTGGKALAYIGAAKRLRARLADHVRGDVRQAGVLAVCPATGVREIWELPSAEAAFERETGIAIDYSNSHPGVLVACNGSWF